MSGASLVAVATITANATVTANDATVKTTETPTQPDLTILGLPVTHTAEYRWAPLSDGSDGKWLVEVVTSSGEVKTGPSIDGDEIKTLVKLIRYALPPGHTKHPRN